MTQTREPPTFDTSCQLCLKAKKYYLQKKVETSDHLKNGATPKSQTIRK